MDCQTASDWMAGWVDEELSPGERELMDAHLQRCPSCRQRAHAMARQAIAPPISRVLRPDFWDRMDAALSEAQDNPLPEPEPVKASAPTRVSLLQQRFQLSPVVMLTYAALLICALGWGLYSHTTLKEARAEAASLQTELERERRLTGQPVLASPQGYRAPQNRNNRGTL